jgi:hypothetical protein
MSDWTQSGIYIGHETMPFLSFPSMSNYTGDIVPKPMKRAKTKKNFDFLNLRKSRKLLRQ